MNTTTPWIRTPLDPNLPTIRILQLRRGVGDEPIKVALQVVSLHDEPHFEVLSYVWGDPNATRRIEVDRVPFQVTVNLFGFLHSLRLRSDERYLWADAICIDQNSEQEKSHQIGLMTRIYRQANVAHVWFGPFDPEHYWRDLDSDGKYTPLSSMTPEKWKLYEHEGTTCLAYLLRQDGFKPLSQHGVEVFATQCRSDIFQHTLATLDDMAKDDHLYTYPAVTYVPHGEHSIRYAHHRNWLAVMDCIRWLVTRPWWSRVWTLQEATLPRADPTVHAPPYSFRLSRLLNGVESMIRHNNSICCKWFGQPITTSNRDDGDFGAAYSQCRAVHAQRAILAEAAQEGLGVPLDMVTSATQERKATEIRDHWFGVFGFLPQQWQAQSKLFPTPKTTAELFSQYANLLYLETKDLTLLDGARRCNRSPVDDLPSWAIDLSSPRKRNEEDCDRWKLYSACGAKLHNRTVEWLDLRKPNLSVGAIRVSTVQACFDRALSLSHSAEDLRELVSAWLTLYRDTTQPFDGDAFWRACFMDRNVQTHWLSKRKGPLNNTRLRDIKDWWTAWDETRDHRDLTPDRKSGGEKRGSFHHKELQMNAEKNRFFITSQNLPGLGPHDMLPGDEVFALAGCKALAVLRESLDESRKGFTVVGLCFVDRWMYGRALQGGAVWTTIELY